MFERGVHNGLLGEHIKNSKHLGKSARESGTCTKYGEFFINVMYFLRDQVCRQYYNIKYEEFGVVIEPNIRFCFDKPKVNHTSSVFNIL